MNIFALSHDPVECAIWHMDKHIVKMPLESAQMLCTTLNELGHITSYKSVHRKHPCTIWAGISRDNFSWLCDLGIQLCKEYTFRYGKIHASAKVIAECFNLKNNLPSGSLTPFAQAMPDEFKDPESITAYRNYYKGGKSHIASWKLRTIPEWYS